LIQLNSGSRVVAKSGDMTANALACIGRFRLDKQGHAPQVSGHPRLEKKNSWMTGVSPVEN